MAHTLDISNTLLEDLLENLRVLELLLDLGDNGLSKLLLLALLNLALVSNPRVKNGLGLSGQGSLLLELESLSLKLGGLLQTTVISHNPCCHPTSTSYLPWKPRTGSW